MRKKRIKIAMIAPGFGETGGPEVAVQNLVSALLKKKVDVTLFAPADWKTKAKHVPTIQRSLWNMPDFENQTEQIRRNFLLENLLKVLEYQDKFDVIHLNSFRYAASIGSLLSKPSVLTYHSRILADEFEQIKKTGVSVVALSERHKNNLSVSAVIENGIETEKISYSLERGSYLITVGRILEQKGIDRAIKIAQKANKKLLIFGRIGVSKERQSYFNKKVKPYLNDRIVHYNEVPSKVLFQYIKKAEALLFPYRTTSKSLSVCPLVVMEALACGTPVIGAPIDPLPNSLEDQAVACLSRDINVLIGAAKAIEKFDRRRCREVAEKYFDNSIMAEKYIKLYEKILSKKRKTKNNH